MILECAASDVGRPAVAEYRWTRNGHVIPEMSDSFWNVSQVTLNYQANYSCTPVNEAGEGDTSQVYVQVYGNWPLTSFCTLNLTDFAFIVYPH